MPTCHGNALPLHFTSVRPTGLRPTPPHPNPTASHLTASHLFASQPHRIPPHRIPTPPRPTSPHSTPPHPNPTASHPSPTLPQRIPSKAADHQPRQCGRGIRDSPFRTSRPALHQPHSPASLQLEAALPDATQRQRATPASDRSRVAQRESGG